MSRVAMSARLLEAETKVEDLKNQIAELQKTIKSTESMRDHYRAAADRIEKEYQLMHTILDMLPAAPGRKTEAEESWQQKDVDLPTRFVVFLATRAVLP